MVNAVILAGDSKGLHSDDVANKALIKIKDRYMIDYVIDSLKSASNVDKIIIVGPPSVKEIFETRVDMVLLCEGSMIDNIKKAELSLGDDEYFLLCTCDIPMVSSEAIEDFIIKCAQKKVDIGYPIIEKSLNDRKYPDAKRTYVKMKDGIFTGGNIVYANREALRKCYPIAEKLVENRKNPLKMGKFLGIITLIKLLLGILKIRNVEKRANKLLGVDARAIITPFPEIGNDVDKKDDVDFVIKYMGISG